jgi:hypothetical protein
MSARRDREVGAPARAVRWLRRVGALALLAAAACDSGPKGPGYLSATIEGPVPLGAAIVEVQGEGVLGFEGAGTTHVFSAPGSTASLHRVVLVGESPGDLRFRVQVQELGDRPPSATIVSASGGDDIPLATVQAFQVRIVR